MSTMTERRILQAHWHLPHHDAGLYAQLLGVAEGITPRVQAIQPDSAHLDITGALRYWGRDPEGLAALLRMRTLALHGVQTTCAIAPNRMLATMAAATTPPGLTTVIEAEDIERWLRPRPVAALYGVGPATAAKLRTYGLHTIGDIADTPLPTLVRLFGAAAAAPFTPTPTARTRAPSRPSRSRSPWAPSGPSSTTSWTRPSTAEPCSH